MLHHRSAAGQILINNKGYCYLDIKRYNLVVYDDFNQIVGVFPKHKGDRPNGGLNDHDRTEWGCIGSAIRVT